MLQPLRAWAVGPSAKHLTLKNTQLCHRTRHGFKRWRKGKTFRLCKSAAKLLMQGQILMPIGISAGLPHEATLYPAGITASKSSPYLSGHSLQSWPVILAAQVKLNTVFPRLKTWGLVTSQPARGVAGVGTGFCSHAPLPWQQEHAEALRGLARKVAGLGLGTGHHKLPVTAAWFISHICHFLLWEF